MKPEANEPEVAKLPDKVRGLTTDIAYLDDAQDRMCGISPCRTYRGFIGRSLGRSQTYITR